MDEIKIKDLEKFVYEYATKYPEGFIWEEQKQLLLLFPKINKDKYWEAMKGNTCIMRNGHIVSYHCDILTALRCGLENRDMYDYEWD